MCRETDIVRRLFCGSTEPLIGTLPFWFWCVVVALDGHSGPTVSLTALLNYSVFAIAGAEQGWREVDSAVAAVAAS